MSTWRGWYTTVASTYIDVVEADDYDDAMAKIDDAISERGFPSLCAQCSGWHRVGVELGEWEPADEKHGPNVEEIEP